MYRLLAIRLAVSLAFCAAIPPAMAGGGSHPGPYLVQEQPMYDTTRPTRKAADRAAKVNESHSSAMHRFAHFLGLTKDQAQTK